MGRPGFSLDGSIPVIADTSALINLNATGCAAAILEAFPSQVIVTEAVLLDMQQPGVRNQTGDAEQTAKLISDGLITKWELGADALDHFADLTIGSAGETLDDGEAATIALALERQAIAIVDEKKGRRICAKRYPKLSIACSTDLLCHASVEKRLGKPVMKMAVLRALQQARMNVTPDQLDWILNLIGATNAEACPSLPRSARTGKNC
jgi:predicted nucleic acid-binding protein